MNQSATVGYDKRSHHQSSAALWLIAAAEIAVLCLPLKSLGIAGLTIIATGVFLAVVTIVLTGRKHLLVVGWVATFPLGYYWFSFPKEHSLITLDRVLIVLLLGALAFSEHQQAWQIPSELNRAGLAWAIFLAFSAATIPRSITLLGTFRMWMDAFLLPAILAWYIIRYVDIRRYLPALHIVASIMTIYVAGIGVAEVFLQRDLLPLPEGGVIVAGDYASAPDDLAAQIFIRPNGPFSTVNSFAMVGVVSLFFLSFLRQALSDRIPAWQSLLHHIAIAAAIAQSLMPLFKSVLASFLLILIIDAFCQRGWRRGLRIALMFGSGLLVALLAFALPAVFTERADPITFYARLAQEKQTFDMFLSHPLNGVGLNNFHPVAEKTALTYYDNEEALDYPHNNLGAVLAETGILGLLPFVASQVFLFSAFRKICHLGTQESKLVWKTFLFIFLAFWINGMALTIVYFQDSNLWYMFVLAVLYKFASTVPGRPLTHQMSKTALPI
ncbi:MAG TPA: O-antigen ligase family protein [Terriglobales bacterium]|nr:O-antigen ligase family protein [Terriglobales bacterium]